MIPFVASLLWINPKVFGVFAADPDRLSHSDHYCGALIQVKAAAVKDGAFYPKAPRTESRTFPTDPARRNGLLICRVSLMTRNERQDRGSSSFERSLAWLGKVIMPRGCHQTTGGASEAPGGGTPKDEFEQDLQDLIIALGAASAPVFARKSPARPGPRSTANPSCASLAAFPAPIDSADPIPKNGSSQATAATSASSSQFPDIRPPTG